MGLRSRSVPSLGSFSLAPFISPLNTLVVWATLCPEATRTAPCSPDWPRAGVSNNNSVCLTLPPSPISAGSFSAPASPLTASASTLADAAAQRTPQPPVRRSATYNSTDAGLPPRPFTPTSTPPLRVQSSLNVWPVKPLSRSLPRGGLFPSLPLHRRQRHLHGRHLCPSQLGLRRPPPPPPSPVRTVFGAGVSGRIVPSPALSFFAPHFTTNSW